MKAADLALAFEGARIGAVGRTVPFPNSCTHYGETRPCRILYSTTLPFGTSFFGLPWSSSEKCKQADNRLLLFSFGDACQGTESIGVSTRMRRRSTPYQPPLRLVGCGRLGNGQALSPCATVHEVPRDVESANAEWPDRGTTTGITDAARAGNIGGSVVPNAMHNEWPVHAVRKERLVHGSCSSRARHHACHDMR